MTDSNALIYGETETSVRKALEKATWLTEADEAARDFLIQLAGQYDNLEEDFVDGRLTREAQLKGQYNLRVHMISLFKQLGLTPESRQGVPEQKTKPKETDSERRMRERKARRQRLSEHKA